LGTRKQTKLAFEQKNQDQLYLTKQKKEGVIRLVENSASWRGEQEKWRQGEKGERSASGLTLMRMKKKTVMGGGEIKRRGGRWPCGLVGRRRGRLAGGSIQIGSETRRDHGRKFKGEGGSPSHQEKNSRKRGKGINGRTCWASTDGKRRNASGGAPEKGNVRVLWKGPNKGQREKEETPETEKKNCETPTKKVRLQKNSWRETERVLKKTASSTSPSF